MTRTPRPSHGFPESEFEARLARAQRAMTSAGLDALVVTTPQNIRYFTGFETQFWESPTRPWYLVVPADGERIAVFPAIGEPGLRASTGVSDVRTWSSPHPRDDGVSLLSQTLCGLTRRQGRIGWELGRESVIRAPLLDVREIERRVAGIEFVDGSRVIWDLRMVKSAAEIVRLRYICGLASDTARSILEDGTLHRGLTTREAEHATRMSLLRAGADHVPFLATAAGHGGYDQIIAGPGDRRLGEGDVLFIDYGATFDGYFCDFDRNYAVGKPSPETESAYAALLSATDAGIATARPGVPVRDVFAAMARVLDAAGSTGHNVGRLGHGLGLHLTEPPSFMPEDETVLQAGMVMCIEPAISTAPGRMLVDEECIVIRDGEPEILTRRSPRALPRLA